MKVFAGPKSGGQFAFRFNEDITINVTSTEGFEVDQKNKAMVDAVNSYLQSGWLSVVDSPVVETQAPQVEYNFGVEETEAVTKATKAKSA